MFHKMCVCSGHWRARRSRWVAIQRAEQRTLVKCLACGFKWWSRAKHAMDLKDHVERSYGKLSDEEVLSLVREGRIYVDFDRAAVWKQEFKGVGSGRGKFDFSWQPYFTRLATVADQHRGYLFVHIYHDRRRRKIAVHRLVMMAHLGRPIREDCDVDHRDRVVTHNWLSNLRERLKSENRATSKRPTQEPSLPF